MWFYVRNLSSSLPLRTPGPPVKRLSWNSRGGKADQVHFLLGEIEGLKLEHQITGASVVAHWSIRGVQPLQRRVHLAIEYTGEEDPTRYTREKISEDDLENRVAAVLKNVDWSPSLSGAFRAGMRPQEVLLRVADFSSNQVILSSSRVDLVSFVQINSENYQSRPPLPEDVSLAHTNSSVHLTSFVLHLRPIELLDS